MNSRLLMTDYLSILIGKLHTCTHPVGLEHSIQDLILRPFIMRGGSANWARANWLMTDLSFIIENLIEKLQLSLA